VTHTEIIHEYPAPIPTMNYPAIAIEELSQRYKALIEAERKHFLNTEHEYNDFIYKMDMIHQELEGKLHHQQNITDELKRDNEEMARRLREIDNEYEKKSETLKKLYYVHSHQTKKLEACEFDNQELRTTIDKTSQKNFDLQNDLKHMITERNYLEERMADLQARHTMELNRLQANVTDKERQILDRDREIDRLNSELRRAQEDAHRLKMDLDSSRMNYEGILRNKDLETTQVRRMLEEQRDLTRTETRHVPLVDFSGNEETIRRLKASLEEAYKTIEDLSRKKHIEYIDKPRIVEKVVEKIVEKPVERIVRVSDDEYRHSPDREREKRSGAKGRRPDVGDDDGWDEDRLEKLVLLTQKTYEKKITHLYYIIWKLLFHIDHLDNLLKKARGGESNRGTQRQFGGKDFETVSESPEGFISVYHDVRRGIVDYIFEVFIRSANHAHQKKVNSLILFIINIKELKEHNVGVFLLLLDTFMRIRDLVKHRVKGEMTSTYAINAKSPDKRKTVDAEFRDMTNSWIQDTLQNVKRRRGYDKHDVQNMEYLYLFRLLAIKYRVVYPLRGKAFEVDADLAVKLENKICKAFRRAMEIDDVDIEKS